MTQERLLADKIMYFIIHYKQLKEYKIHKKVMAHYPSEKKNLKTLEWMKVILALGVELTHKKENRKSRWAKKQVFISIIEPGNGS